MANSGVRLIKGGMPIIRNRINLLRIAFQNRAYYLDRTALKQSKLPAPDHLKIAADFEALGITVVPYLIDVNDFNEWLEKAEFPTYYVDDYGEVFTEKALEHYVGVELLPLEQSDTLVDVAACNSPWYEMAERMYGCQAFALDLEFSPGVNGKRIGADATHMPLPDGFATKMALHCAYEMFEGTADIRLLQEASRVLRDNGKMVILPLYMDDFYYVLSSPYTDRQGLDYGGAELVWREDPHRMRFSRHYSVEAFRERIVANINGLTLRIYHVENASEVSPKCYLKFVALFEKCPNPCDGA
jgi:SAM-dependent methyltransferase